MAGEQRVEAVERAFSILGAFSDGTRSLSLTELSRRTGLYPSTILRLAASLERFGYIRRDQAGAFWLGHTLWRLGVLYQANFDLAEFVRPVLRYLCGETGETAALYVREGDKRICLYRVNGTHVIRSHLEEGAELPLDRGASAHILMAYTGGVSAKYDNVRKQGYVVSLGERDADAAAVSVPLFGKRGEFVGALALTGPLRRFSEDNQLWFRKLLVEQAELLKSSIN